MAHGQAGAEIVKDGSPSLTCNHEAPIVAFEPGIMSRCGGHTYNGVSGTLRKEPGDNQMCIAIQDCSGRDKNQNGIGVSEVDTAYTVDAAATQGVCFAQNQIGEVREGSVANTLNQNSNASGRNTGLVRVTSQVRRITPIEAERLQGFPDDYTNIPWRLYKECQRKGWSYEAELLKHGMHLRGPSLEDCPDGPRYKALGNSFAVPVVHCIGRRIQEVSEI